ncbi:hypothetical protein BD310DRAFT_905504 [Dichomitus squalens]|uniref:HAT C-terminal dimerisation domain-containing protein n=1 Tax=Dichomitus squalens TaxID=114155 RepID=A0A4Q9PZS7_9APHY|nr:hypothetical protein BD310DRAFT_905504 [Dichomitus squalens]
MGGVRRPSSAVINQWVMDSDDATQQLFLTVQEWDMLGKIASLLEVFTKVTKEMSRSGTPTLPYALPMYERMRKCLNDHARDEKVSPDIRNAAAAGLEKLLEYYDLAKASQYTILATMLHPSLRLNWLTSVYGDDCREGYRALFTHVYTTYEAASLNAQTPPPAPPTQADNSDFLSEVCTVQRIPHRDIGSDDATQRVFSAMEEIDRYLRGEGGSGTFHDPLKWWRHLFQY